MRQLLFWRIEIPCSVEAIGDCVFYSCNFNLDQNSQINQLCLSGKDRHLREPNFVFVDGELMDKEKTRSFAILSEYLITSMLPTQQRGYAQMHITVQSVNIDCNSNWIKEIGNERICFAVSRKLVCFDGC